jgi:hypothetical protein
MTTPSQTCHSRGCKIEVPQNFGERGLCLEHFLAEATKRLDAATQCFRLGKGIDNQALDWLLLQVDFVVETMSDETVALNEDQHSNLLELLLAIANLNEHVRQYATTVQPVH